MEQINKVIPQLKESNSTIEYYHNRKKHRKQFKEVYRDMLNVLVFLEKKNVKKGERVGIIGKNSYEWVLLDLACLAAGMIVVPFDTHLELSNDEIIKEYQLSALFTNLAERYSDNKIIYRFDEITQKIVGSENYKLVPVKYHPEDIIAVKFTSGTTRNPKSLETKKKSIDDCITNIQAIFNHNENDKIMLFMPLYLLQQRFFIYSSILFDYKLLVVPFELVFMSMKADQPTVIMGVPHFFENLQKVFLQTLVNKNIFSRLCYKSYVSAKKILQFLIKKPYKPFLEMLGGKIRYLWTGSAPMGMDTLLFFRDMGVSLYQGYGTAETGIISKNCPSDDKMGSVGKPFSTRFIKFDENGQILVKSKYEINTRYYKASARDNALVFRDDGYVATGDIGYLDEDGFLYITGRIKDMVVFNNGRKVFPTPIEKKFQNSRLIKNCVVYGDNKPYLVALIVPESESPDETLIKYEVESINSKLSPEEKIYNYFIYRKPFTIKNGMLNSQGKIRRQFIIEKFKKELNALYKSS